MAVMGFKCRVMQLQGELNDLHKKGPADAVARGEIERLKEENQSLRTDLTRAREEADAARRQAQQAQLSQQARQSTVSGSRHEKVLDVGGVATIVECTCTRACVEQCMCRAVRLYCIIYCIMSIIAM